MSQTIPVPFNATEAGCVMLGPRVMESDAAAAIRLVVARLSESDPSTAADVLVDITRLMQSDPSPRVRNVLRQFMESDAGAALALELRRLMESSPSDPARKLLRAMESDRSGDRLVDVLRAVFESDPSLMVQACLLDSSRLARNVRIRRGLEGPQIVVQWDAPSCTMPQMTIRVVRRLYSFPMTPTDGLTVFEGLAAAGCIADIDLDACHCYYYTVFTHISGIDQWVFSVDTQVNEIAIETGFFAERLISMLPDLYLNQDKVLERSGEGVFPLFRALDAPNCEWRNLHENTDPSVEPKKKGPLRRFLRTVAADLDLVKGLLDCMPTVFDVDETCCQVLPGMAALIGLDLNRELPCSAQREEIKNEVAVYKIKGTAAALVAKIRAIAGVDAVIQEHCRSIVISNSGSSTTATSGGSGSAIDFPDLGVSITPKDGRAFISFTVHLVLGCDDCLSQPVIAKILRIFPSYVPACRIGDLSVVDCRFVEEYDDSRLGDTAEDEGEEVEGSSEDARGLCWLISNRSGSTTNGFDVTLTPTIVCREVFFDEADAEDSESEDVCSFPWIISNDPARTTPGRMPGLRRSWITPTPEPSCGLASESWSDESERDVDEEPCAPWRHWLITNCVVRGVPPAPDRWRSLSNSLDFLSATPRCYFDGFSDDPPEPTPPPAPPGGPPPWFSPTPPGTVVEDDMALRGSICVPRLGIDSCRTVVLGLNPDPQRYTGRPVLVSFAATFCSGGVFDFMWRFLVDGIAVTDWWYERGTWTIKCRTAASQAVIPVGAGQHHVQVEIASRSNCALAVLNLSMSSIEQLASVPLPPPCRSTLVLDECAPVAVCAPVGCTSGGIERPCPPFPNLTFPTG